MKVILLNGSPNEKGCTYTGLDIIAQQLKTHNVDSELYWVGKKPIQHCIACRICKQEANAGKCVYDQDLVNTVAQALDSADALIIGSAVHYASSTGAVSSFCDRLFFSSPPSIKKLKFGASIVSCRRGGNSATFDQLNKYFTISQMPIVSSCYWNGIHGMTPEDVLQDHEGVRIMKTLANNMAYMIKMKHTANLPQPKDEPMAVTHFIR